MEYTLEIILSEAQLADAGLSVKKVFWDGEEHECVPRQFYTEEGIAFIEASHGKICEMLLQETFISDPVLVSLDIKDQSAEVLVNSGKLEPFTDKLKNCVFELYLWEVDEAVDSEYVFTSDMKLDVLMKNAVSMGRNIRVIKDR